MRSNSDARRSPNHEPTPPIGNNAYTGARATTPLAVTNENPDSPYSFQARGRWLPAEPETVEAASQQVLDDSNAPFYRWFPDGELNTCANALDRHIAERGDQAVFDEDGIDIQNRLADVAAQHQTDGIFLMEVPGVAIAGIARVNELHAAVTPHAWPKVDRHPITAPFLTAETLWEPLRKHQPQFHWRHSWRWWHIVRQ